MKRKRLHCALCLEVEWVESGDGVVSVQVKTEHSFCTGFLINTYCMALGLYSAMFQQIRAKIHIESWMQ